MGSNPTPSAFEKNKEIIMKSVVVCGSKKYKDDIHQFCQRLEELGVMVFEPNFDEPVNEDQQFETQNITKSVFKGLTLEHFDWIRKAEVCYLFNKDNYCGISVSMEMGFASALSKPIFALSFETGDPCRNALIDKVVTAPEELVKLLS